MFQMFRIFEEKLTKSGLAQAGAPLLGSLDADLEWNRKDPDLPVFEAIFEQLNINSLIFSRPAEPYRSIVDFLAETSNGVLTPQDCETRTFLHDLPVSFQFSADEITSILKKRKSVILPNRGIVTYGMAGLEQAYVTFASVCFACFIKFFSDFLWEAKRGNVDEPKRNFFQGIVKQLDPPVSFQGSLMEGPFNSEDGVCEAIQEAGRLVVEHRLVDSYFGNISFCHGRTLYISQTGSSLDELKGCIDPCPLDGSSCAPITASSELPAHLKIVQTTGYRAILHGHPKFCVILSMDCDIEDCKCRGTCHLRCPHDRSVRDIPIVSGEVGSGPYSLCNTVPHAIGSESSVIVHGHGVFTAGTSDFNQPFKKLAEIENICRAEYFKRVEGVL